MRDCFGDLREPGAFEGFDRDRVDVLRGEAASCTRLGCRISTERAPHGKAAPRSTSKEQFVTAITFASITFACTFGCALAGTFIRSWLPPPHLSKESQRRGAPRNRSGRDYDGASAWPRDRGGQGYFRCAGQRDQKQCRQYPDTGPPSGPVWRRNEADAEPDPPRHRLSHRRDLAVRRLQRSRPRGLTGYAADRGNPESDPPAGSDDRCAALAEGRGAEAERRRGEDALASTWGVEPVRFHDRSWPS